MFWGIKNNFLIKRWMKSEFMMLRMAGRLDVVVAWRCFGVAGVVKWCCVWRATSRIKSLNFGCPPCSAKSD